MLVLTVGSFWVFGEIPQMTVNYKSDLGLLWFPSFVFSLHILVYQGLSAYAPKGIGNREYGIGVINSDSIIK